MQAPIVDLSYLLEYTDGDEELIDELVEVFKETAVDALGGLKEGVKEDAEKTWKAAAHKFKGAAGYVGASGLKALCHEAEMLEASTSAERVALYQKIEHSYADVCSFLKDRKS